jgi:Vitamin K-dependent gamma-carboxylase
VLADLASRATDLRQHYTDAGILPRTALVEQVLSPWAFSLNLMNGQLFFQALLFVAAAVAALCMLFGYRTRLMTIVLWVLLLSIQWRNPLVGGSDGPLLRMLLFWAMFLPLGACWSVDRAKSTVRRVSTGFLSMATFALFLQIAFVYWFTAVLKSGPEWRVDGTAIYYALSLDQISTQLGDYLLNFPELLKFMTFSTYGLEAFGPLLLFCPFFTGPVRTAAVFAFMSLHFGIWLTMDIGIFPWISALCMVCFLPAWFWEKGEKLGSMLSGRIGVARRLQGLVARLSHANGSPIWARLPFVMGTRQLSFAGPTLSDERPAIRAGGEIGTPPAGTPNGERQRHEDPEEPTRLRSSLATNLISLFLLLYVLCWNLSTVSVITMPERAIPPGPFLGVDQYWAMFAPSPSREDGWYVIPGTLRGGQRVDLMSVTRDDYNLYQVSWEKPQDVNATYKNEHWRKYLENIWQEQHADQRLHFGRYICREWNARHTGTEQLRSFQITYMLEETLPDYQQAPPEKVVLWEHSCF